MKSKKLAIILISAVFAIVLICAVFTTFTIRRVDAVFEVSEENNVKADEIRAEINRSVGGNLIFCNLDAIRDSVEKNPYFEVSSIVKKYPDVIEIEIKERREIYVAEIEDETFILSENGLVMAKFADYQESREHIKLDLTAFSSVSAVVGQFIQTDNDQLLATIFDLTTKARLTDCIKSVSAYKPDNENFCVAFKTYTGTTIEIAKVFDDGDLKLEKALEAYDGETIDYIKSSNTILASKNTEGKVFVQWLSRG